MRPVTQPDRSGRARAQRAFPGKPCEVCGLPYGNRRVDRHHRDGDRMNNDPGNIAFLCKRHHSAAHRSLDGRVGGGVRPRVNDLQRDRARARSVEARVLLAKGATIIEAAGILRVHPGTIYSWLHKYPSKGIDFAAT